MHLRVRINKRLDNFTLDVDWAMANEFTVLFGHSGAGKSLTLRMIAGLMTPDSGYIELNGVPLFDSQECPLVKPGAVKNAQRVNVRPQDRCIGFVFQDLALFPHMSVAQNIAYAGKRKDRERVAALIESFHLKGLEGKLPSEISGGQRQRVAIARAIMCNPQCLLMDEPFSSLDNTLRLQMRALIKDVRNQLNIPVVFITHDIYEAYTMADKLIVYNNGKSVQTGTPDEILSTPRNSSPQEEEEGKRKKGAAPPPFRTPCKGSWTP
ncbi:MAG: ATP-binding cassette domain-containing protein [Nitrospirae bacterium]|nr:ATP-binding cassette domain-containing protein [Nitrospirota bacterium]MBF0592844.1 ATP-binding cassette domain-containing protein [Nitrospirota bacterium]